MTRIQAIVASVIGVAVITGTAYAQAVNSPQLDSYIDCVERFEVPDYPVIARAARIEANITTSAVLSPQASVQLIKSDARSTPGRANGLLVEAVEKALSIRLP